MKTCVISTPETQLSSLNSSFISSFNVNTIYDSYTSLTQILQSLLFESTPQLFNSITFYDFISWSKVPQLISLKKKYSLPNINSGVVKQILTKSKIFKSEFSFNLCQSISLGKNQFLFSDFKRFYEELDQIMNPQRLFHYFNKCNEFVLIREEFDRHFGLFDKLFKKQLKSSNLILEVLVKRNHQIEDLKKDVLYLDYIKMINDFKNSIARNSISSFFEDSETKIDKKKFVKGINCSKTFPLMYLFEFLRLEKEAISFMLKEKGNGGHESKQKGLIKKFLMNEIKKNLKRCERNGDPSCFCTFCKCVRKNRETAIQSQKRKREKIEELDRLKEEYNILENEKRILRKENLELQAENETRKVENLGLKNENLELKNQILLYKMTFKKLCVCSCLNCIHSQ